MFITVLYSRIRWSSIFKLLKTIYQPPGKQKVAKNEKEKRKMNKCVVTCGKKKHYLLKDILFVT